MEHAIACSIFIIEFKTCLMKMDDVTFFEISCPVKTENR